MKVGILTFWWTEDNYGQVLQMYALQTYLRSLGHEPFLIRYLSIDDSGQNRDLAYYRKALNPIKLFNFIRHTVRDKRLAMIKARELKEHPRYFEAFRKQYINMTEQVYYTASELKNNPPEADAYIVGSDQVWNFPDIDNSVHKIGIYFLDFGKERVKRISYAASYSQKDFPDRFYNIIRPLLAKFQLISVREQDGINICKKADRHDALLFPDPTLLIRQDQWKKMANVKVPQKHCLLYLLGNKTDISIPEIQSYATKNGLKLNYVASQGRHDSYEKVYPSINEWLSMVASTDLMITNSFHGTVFAILYNVPFVVYPLSGEYYQGMNGRINSLLEKLYLQDRIFKNNLIEISKKGIDWNYVNEIIEKDRIYVKQNFDHILDPI